jgi:hypothetical protein
MSTRLVSHIDAFRAKLSTASDRAIVRMTTHLHGRCQLNVNRSNPRNRKTGIYDSPSKPGESPRARTGFGRDNIQMELLLDKKTGNVGVGQNGIYMLYLELGFRRGNVTIRAKKRFLMIPWTKGEPSKDEIKKVGLKKINGGWYYFRKQVTLPAITVAPRPWLVKTLNEEWETLKLLGESELKAGLA